MAPGLDRIDHIHVYVTDRSAAEAWYERVLGFRRAAALGFWATDGGPLTLADASGQLHIALFERPHQHCRSTVAFGVGGAALLQWQHHLGQQLGRTPELVDHKVSWSIYFSDPDGNPYEITSNEDPRAAR